MKRWFAMAAVALVWCWPCARAAENEADAARALYLKGRYAEAAERFERIVPQDAASRIGLARCRLATGKRDEAERILREAVEKMPAEAGLQAELALVALDRGDLDAAQSRAAKAIELDKDCVGARWVQAEVLKGVGKLNEAERAYAWFTTYYNRAPRVNSDEELVFVSRGVAEHARWTRNSGQFRRLVNELLPAAVAREPGYWPAHLEAAKLYLEKYNEADAAAEIARGLAINANAAELHAARGELALVRFDLGAAKGAIDRALEINPELAWAHRLRADWLLADLRPAEAIMVLRRALELNPRDEKTLGRLLAALVVTERPGERASQAAKIVEEAEKRNPHCGELYLAAADAMDRMRRFGLAAENFRKAQEKMPQLVSVRGRLGSVLMRLGEEAEAGKLLAESFAIDPFNVRVKNMLEVLDVLKDYATIETEHFVIKFDRGQDELLAKYAARHLEDDIFPQLTKQMGYVPKERTLIEIFSRVGRTSGHSWFSARMVGLPFIGTVGACAGRMVALTSPGELTEKYDWALVLRHELVHVLNLQQTDFAVPHWLTEGLAVHLEGQPRPKKWTEILVRRAKADELFDLDTLTLGFIRPQSSDDWTLAYCQAELYVEYLLATYGEDAITKLLAAYADRCSTEEALSRCYGVMQADLEKAYREFVASVVANERDKLPRERPPLAELSRRAEAKPGDSGAAADLALAWLERDDKPEARRWALAATRIEAKQPIAAYVLARLQLSIGDEEAAIKLLEEALDKAAPNEEVLALLASLRLKGGDEVGAEELYRMGATRFSGGDRWIKGLARIYLHTGEADKLVPVLRQWSELEPDNIAIHKKITQLELARRDFAAAAKWARRALHLDVQDAEVHSLLGAALAGEKKQAAAIAEYEVAIRLDTRQADSYAALAELQIELGRVDDARLVLGRLKELAPDHAKLSELEKGIQK
jgi:cellulose synthase operon protein C